MLIFKMTESSLTGVENYAKYILTVQYFHETSLFFLNLIQQILKTSLSRGVKIKSERYFSTACWVQKKIKSNQIFINSIMVSQWGSYINTTIMINTVHLTNCLKTVNVNN